MPDGKFPTCPYPNPEIRQVFECGLKLTETEKADMMLATDPDCDRVGIAVLTGDEYVLLSGNDVGVLLAEYMLSAKKEKGIATEGTLMTKSFVSTPLINKVAAKYGCKVVDVLTGFKYVGEFIANLEEKEKYRCGQILKEPMTGYKKTKEGIVITATIPAGAIVFCINGSKCRTNKARIIDMGGQNEVLHSSYNNKFEYRLMQDIKIEDFNLIYNVECASGFHFFRTREEAEKYNQ